MHSDSIRRGSSTAWQLWLGGVVTGALGTVAFQSAFAIVSGLASVALGVVELLGSIPWQ